MGIQFQLEASAVPLFRPRLMIEAARTGAARYQRARDLPGALAGTGPVQTTASRTTILARLTKAEAICENLRRGRSPAYRPGRHVQVLSALLAEASAVQAGRAQAKASGSEALRVAT